MKLTTLHALYIEELRALYSAEHQLLHTLPRLGKASTAPQLREAFTELLHQSQAHVDRLDKMFVRLGAGPKGSHCFGMEGLVNEGKDLLDEAAELTVKDAALISAGRRLGSYMTARFGCASMLARRLGQGKASVLLQEMENESEAMDENLIALADTIIQQTADVDGALP